MHSSRSPKRKRCEERHSNWPKTLYAVAEAHERGTLQQKKCGILRAGVETLDCWAAVQGWVSGFRAWVHLGLWH